MRRNFVLPIFVVLVVSLQACAVNIVNSDLSSFFEETSPQAANATCFMYQSGDFKCACRFSDNSKVWSSRNITEITGLSNLSPKYGYIKQCENSYPVKAGQK